MTFSQEMKPHRVPLVIVGCVLLFTACGKRGQGSARHGQSQPERSNQMSSPRPTAPRHLKSFLTDVIFDRDQVRGKVKCSCGNQSLHLLYAGERNTDSDKQFLQSKEVGGHWHYRLGFRCGRCWKEELIFDQDFHGYNGFYAGSDKDRQVPRLGYLIWACHACGCDSHKMDVGVALDETALDEGVSSEDWCDAYGWFTLETTCDRCGLAHMVGERETM